LLVQVLVSRFWFSASSLGENATCYSLDTSWYNQEPGTGREEEEKKRTRMAPA